MSISLCCCLIVFALTSHVAADFVYKAVNETQQITLHCQQTIKGDVTWSITVDGDDDIKQTNDPRYNYQADRSLLIIDAKFSDSGRYYCNNEAAVELTVIPSGTTIKSVRETETVTLKCPDEDEESEGSKWSRQFREIPQQRFQMKEEEATIKDVKQEDTGLYYCGGKPAVFLNVTSRSATKKPFRKTPTTISTTASTTTSKTTPTTISTMPTATNTPIPKGSWRSTNPIPKTTTSATTLTPETSSNIYMFLSMWIKSTITVAVTIIIILLIITISPTWRLRREADKKNTLSEKSYGE